jgi:hypothetical protein
MVVMYAPGSPAADSRCAKLVLGEQPGCWNRILSQTLRDELELQQRCTNCVV